VCSSRLESCSKQRERPEPAASAWACTIPRSSAAAPTSPGTRSASSWPTSPILGTRSSSRASCLPRRAILRTASARSERRAAASAGASIRPSGMWSPPTWSAGSGSSSRLGSCWRRRRFRQVGALDLPRLEALEQDPALEALGDLANVVLEALQLRDRGLLDDRAVADDPHRRAAADIALGHVAARDRPESRDPEQGPDLDLADRLLRRDRAEHADERLLDVLGQLVDDAVGADLDALALGELARLG